MEQESYNKQNILAVTHSFFNIKYKWSLRKYWIGWFKRDIKRFYYSKIYGFNMNSSNGTMIPTTGKGKYVSVYSKGEIIQIKHESGFEHIEFDEIRIIPSKENHGVMVERFKNGKMCNRNHMDLNQFNKGIIFASNVEELASR
jgi:hypothetical protein